MEKFMLPCLNKQLFGFDCPGCGAQRALLMVFQGNLSGALQLFPAIYPILILLLFLLLNFFVKFKGDWYVKAGLIIASGAMILGSYLYKLSIVIN